ncbi:unnamed protein product [Closterium sp. NIES-54]
MTLRPSTAPQRVPLPSHPASSLLDGPYPESDSLRAASPTVTHFCCVMQSYAFTQGIGDAAEKRNEPPPSKIEALDGSNYEEWSGRMRSAFKRYKLLKLATGEEKMPEEGDARNRWIEKSAVLYDLILQSVNNNMFQHIKDLVELDDSGPKAWKLLRDVIQPNTLPMVIVLEKELAALSMRPGDDVKPVLDKIKDTYARMAAAGSNVSQMQQCTKIISVLDNSWDNLILTLNTQQDQWTPEWLRQQILQEDFRRRHTGGGATNKTAEGYGAAGGSRGRGGGRGRGRGRGFGRGRGRGDYNEGHGSSGGRGSTRMEGACWYCKKAGHPWFKSFSRPEGWAPPGMKPPSGERARGGAVQGSGAQGSSAQGKANPGMFLMVEDVKGSEGDVGSVGKVVMHPLTHWVIDSGALLPVIGVGNAKVMGANGGLVGLGNVLLVEGLSANLLSVRRLQKSKAKVTFGPTSCRAKLGKLLLWDLEEKSSCIKDLWQLPIIPWNGKPPATAAAAVTAKETMGGEETAATAKATAASAPTYGALDAVKKVQQPQQPHGEGPAPSGVSQVDPAEPVEVAIDSGAESGGAEPAGVGTGGAESWGAESGRVGPGVAEPGGAELGHVEPEGAVSGGAEPTRAASGGALGVPPRREPLSPQQLREWYSWRCRGAAGAPGGPAGASGGAAGAGAAGGATGGGAGAGGAAGASGGAAGAGAAGGAGGAAGTGDPGAEGTGPVSAKSGGAARPRPYYVPLLQKVLSSPPSPGHPPPFLSPPPVQSQLQSASPLPVSPASRSASPVRTVRAGHVSHPRLPPVLGTHSMTLRPSTAPQRVPLPSPPASSLPDGPDPESDSLRAASPTVTRFLATAVTDPLLESSAASALVAELADFAAASRLDYATALVAASASVSVCPPSVGGECTLGKDVLEDRQEEFDCFAAFVPHLVSMLLAPEGYPDALDIPTPRSYAEAIEGPYSSQWQAAMDVEMASWKSTGTYVDEVPPHGANIVSGMWIFRVKRPPGSPPAFKARYVARGFS